MLLRVWHALLQIGLWQVRRGNIAIIVALLAFVLVMISGAAVDFGRLQALPGASRPPNTAHMSFRPADCGNLLESLKSTVDHLQQLKVLNEAMATAGNPV